MFYEFISNISEPLIMFLSANATQTVVLILTAFITLYIFIKQSKQREKEAATIILLEIKSMDKTIRTNVAGINNDGTFDTSLIWCATKVNDKKSWERYRPILLKHFSDEEVNVINKYYEYASVINEQIEVAQSIIYATYESFYVENKAKTLEEIEGTAPKIRTFSQNLEILKKYSEKSIDLFDALPIKKIEKISKR